MKLNNIVLATAVSVMAPIFAFAAEGDLDLTSLTSGFSVTPIINGVLAIAAGLMTLYLSIKGVKIVIKFLRGGD